MFDRLEHKIEALALKVDQLTPLVALVPLYERLVTATVNELRGLNHRQGELMAAIDDLKTAIANEDAEVDAIVAYVADLGQQLADALASNDTAALQALSDDVNSHAAQLQAAVPVAAADVPNEVNKTPNDVPADDSSTDSDTGASVAGGTDTPAPDATSTASGVVAADGTQLTGEGATSTP